MDDKDKSLFESFADTIKHTFDVATDAAKAALEPEPLEPDEELVLIPGPEPVTADLLTSMPPMITVVKKKRRVAKKAPAKAAKKSKQTKKSAKKEPKKVAKKTKAPARKAKKKKKSKGR